MTQHDLRLVGGRPLALRARVPGGKAIWSDLADCEVQGQIRATVNSPAVAFDLTPHLTVAYDGLDVVVDVVLTGADTRSLAASARHGVYDVFLSDVGAVDARAIQLLHGTVAVTTPVTRPGV